MSRSPFPPRRLTLCVLYITLSYINSGRDTGVLLCIAGLGQRQVDAGEHQAVDSEALSTSGKISSTAFIAIRLRSLEAMTTAGGGPPTEGRLKVWRLLRVIH
ncbi:hypothetical protein CYLTODRAFT_262417 [Cylindrobasidium torrendii FP15055 ss-10]|uniref:Uncharacterized protein n=1 Tax=Cylindrobasidium torrendii FP15055 ss-10 TaxID=1314674 RepID=A0A0D7BDQ8_9AGAR|nr:hypothetical protein CYLTODRAFT_262417 [Cylindrobasidium torrendii FP15055 ss-10]